MADFGMQEILT